MKFEYFSPGQFYVIMSRVAISREFGIMTKRPLEYKCSAANINTESLEREENCHN